jgi:hypothetical protein
VLSCPFQEVKVPVEGGLGTRVGVPGAVLLAEPLEEVKVAKACAGGAQVVKVDLFLKMGSLDLGNKGDKYKEGMEQSSKGKRRSEQVLVLEGPCLAQSRKRGVRYKPHLAARRT